MFHQFLAGVLRNRLIALGTGFRRQEHPGLDVDECGRHLQKFTGQVDVEVLDQLDVLQVLLGDPGDGNVVDVHLFLADQMQQEVQRPLKVGQSHLVAFAAVDDGGLDDFAGFRLAGPGGGGCRLIRVPRFAAAFSAIGDGRGNGVPDRRGGRLAVERRFRAGDNRRASVGGAIGRNRIVGCHWLIAAVREGESRRPAGCRGRRAVGG